VVDGVEDLPPPIDPTQLSRITGTHRGFLYQHLYGAACLLRMGASAGERVVIERDEDIELVAPGPHAYVQVKTRLKPLSLGDVSDALDRFAHLRDEHVSCRRKGKSAFVIVANSAPNGPLQEALDGADWPEDVVVAWPSGGRGVPPVDLPPAWEGLPEAITWSTERAREIAFSGLPAETLVWKLAAVVHSAAAGHRSRSFSPGDLPALFEVFLVQLQGFPVPPPTYRAHRHEPQLLLDARVRLISGLPGAGKTAWAVERALHAGEAIVYFDVSGLPSMAVASALARELAATAMEDLPAAEWVGVLNAGAGVDVLRAVDRGLLDQNVQPTIVLDNVHELEATVMHSLINATSNCRIVMLGRPSGALAEVAAAAELDSETLNGWDLDAIAAEFSAADCPVEPATAARVQSLTGGLPLYVRNAAQVTQSAFSRDAAAFCTAIEGSTNLTQTAQEAVLAATFNDLSNDALRVAGALSLSDGPLTSGEAVELLSVFHEPSDVMTSALKLLITRGIATASYGGGIQIHDACRSLARSRSGLASDEWERLHVALRDILRASLDASSDLVRLNNWLRLLPLTGQLTTLVNIATHDMFHEIGDVSGLRATLEAASESGELSLEDHFWALDALAYWDSLENRWDQLGGRLKSMQSKVDEGELGKPEQSALATKTMAFAARHSCDR
jgi:hypothetical protein